MNMYDLQRSPEWKEGVKIVQAMIDKEIKPLIEEITTLKGEIESLRGALQKP